MLVRILKTLLAAPITGRVSVSCRGDSARSAGALVLAAVERANRGLCVGLRRRSTDSVVQNTLHVKERFGPLACQQHRVRLFGAFQRSIGDGGRVLRRRQSGKRS